MRRAVWAVGLVTIVSGIVALFVVAPLAVAPRLDAAYERMSSSPNLAGAVGYGIVWMLLAGAITAGIAHLAAATRRLTAGIGACLLVVGLVLTGLILSSATMSNAIADAAPSNWVAAELPGWVLGWVGVVSLVLALACIVVTARQRVRDRRSRAVAEAAANS